MRTALLMVCVLIVAMKIHAQLQPLNISQWSGKKAMFIVAHPDDIEGTSGGTIALMAKANVQLYYMIVTNGDKGCAASFCMDYTSAQIAACRQEEQLIAAAYFGIPASNVLFTGYEDTMVTAYPEQEIRSDMVSFIRQVKPDVIFTWFPYPRLEFLPSQNWDDLGYHPDHQAVGRITLAAQFDAGVGLLWPNLGPPHSASQFYMVEFSQPSHYVDIGAVLQEKCTAYDCHKSQVTSEAGTEWFYGQIGQRVANYTNIAGLKYAEAFKAYY